jgi:SPP1 family predicted phage head-tail adaptor
MRAGRRDRKIIFERFTTSETVIGAPEETWSTHRTEWAEYIPVSGKEILQLNREVSGELARFNILYTSLISVKDRINFNGKYWDIIAIRELGRNVGLEITAEARA